MSVTRLVENTTYYDLFVGVFIVETRECRGEQAVLALFTNNFDKINPNDFVVAVLAIEELRFHPDKVVPANECEGGSHKLRVDTLPSLPSCSCSSMVVQVVLLALVALVGRLGTRTTRMPRPLTYRYKGGSDTLHAKFDGHGWMSDSSSDESKKVLRVRFRHVGLVHRVIGFGSAGRRRDRPDVRQQPDGSEGQGQGQDGLKGQPTNFDMP